MDSVQTISAG